MIDYWPLQKSTTMTTTVTLYDTNGDLVLSPKPIDYILYGTGSFDERLKYVEMNHHPISKFFETEGYAELFFIALWNEKIVTLETKESVMPHFNQLLGIWLNDFVDHNTHILVQLLSNEPERIDIMFTFLHSCIYRDDVHVQSIHLLSTLCVVLDGKRTFKILQLGRLYSVFYQNDPYMSAPRTSTVWMKSGKTYTVKGVNLNARTESFIGHINNLR